MRKLFAIIICTLLVSYTYSQETSLSRHVQQINRQLKVLSTTSPDLPGGYNFDRSYEGIKGQTSLFDKFIPLLVRVDDVDYFVNVEANIDLETNSFLYMDNGKVYSIPCDRVAEVVLDSRDSVRVFRTTENKEFNPGLKEIKFFQVLKEGPNEFIKIPFKIFIPSDYAGAYTSKRRYDEYKTEYNYYILNANNVYEQVRLNKKSIMKVFPDRKESIREAFRGELPSGKEEMILAVLKKL